MLSTGNKEASSGMTFPVDAVVPAAAPIWDEPLADSLSRRFQRRILALPEADRLVINEPMTHILQLPRVRIDPKGVGSRCHPLIDAVHAAFSLHYPLTLSPDAIWLVIAQGFSHHVAANAEQLRHRLVRHEGQRTLQANVRDLSLASFENAIANFSSQIRDATDPVLHETLVCDFSTTTPAIRTASEVAVMDTFSSYFSYIIRCICGIPKITITGTVEDWQRIRARIEVLATYDLEWWIARLRPILDEFVLAASGTPTPRFWQAIYKPAKVYAAELATGWITDLFPYLEDAPRRQRNPVLEHNRDEWALAAGHGVKLSLFPSGLASATVRIARGSINKVDLVAGFFGVAQNRSDLALSPVISWSITEPPPAKSVNIFA
jgi:hypothetical protein